jgi:hypothetical protein
VGTGRVEEGVRRRIANLPGGDYVGLAGASAHALAASIRSLPLPDPPPPTPAPEAEPEATPAPRIASRTLWIVTLGTLGVLALLTAGLVLLIAGRRQDGAGTAAVGAPQPRPPTAPFRSEPPPAHRPKQDQGDDSDVPRTMLLQPRAALRIVAGPERGREIRLKPEQAITMGRSHSNELVLEDEAISGRHCRLRHEDDGWILHDLGSTNGTHVNERRVDRHRLRGGDLISLGETSLQFVER